MDLPLHTERPRISIALAEEQGEVKAKPPPIQVESKSGF